MVARRLPILVLAVVFGCQNAPMVAPPEGPAANEADAARVLREIVSAENDWKYLDLDRNGRMDYWTRDVTGFFALDRTDMAGARGISKAVALADPVGVKYYPQELKRMKEAPVRGYHFKALLMDERSWPYNLDEDEDGVANTNSSRFGFVAFPKRYGVDGKYTFLVNQQGIIWQKDMGGTSPPHKFPENPEAEGWDARERAGGRGGTYVPSASANPRR